MRAATYIATSTALVAHGALRETGTATALTFFTRRAADGATSWTCPLCRDGQLCYSGTIPSEWTCTSCDCIWVRVVGTPSEGGGMDRDPEAGDTDGGYGDDAVMDMDEEDE